MPIWNVGDRVYVVLGQEKGSETVRILGPGTYQGHEVPPEGRPTMAQLLHEAGVANPKILLDSGEVVWGCEVWWGDYQDMQRTLKGHETKMVTMAEVFKEVEASEAKETPM